MSDSSAFRELARSLQICRHRHNIGGWVPGIRVQETIMFSFDTSDLQRFAVSMIGALILSTACIVAAAAPVRAAEPASQVELAAG